MIGRLELRMVEAVEDIATALEQLVVIEARKAGGGKALEMAARQDRETEGRPVIELVDPENEPGPA